MDTNIIIKFKMLFQFKMSRMSNTSTSDGQSAIEISPEPTDCNQCAICQRNKDESLQCPADSTRQSDFGAGYKTLAENITRFIE
jgi:hypothetical protein